MKTLANLNVPKDISSKFPFGNIQNETPSQDGTPVVREIYGDPLMNFYKIVQLAGIDFTGDEDSDDTQYQIIDALRKFYNELNDVEQILQGSGAVWRVDLDLARLPNKFLFISRPDSDYDSSQTYQFKGIDNDLNYPVTSPTGFSAGDEVLTVIDTSGVRIYTLINSNTKNTTFPVLGSAIGFNDTAKMYYFDDGKLYNNNPKVYEIEAIIRIEAANSNLVVSDVVVMKGNLFCLVYDVNIQQYEVWFYSINDFLSPVKCDLTNFSSASGIDESVYMYCDGEFLYFTNNFNNSIDDFGIKKVSFANTNELTETAFFEVSNTFVKTTNAIFKNDELKTFIGSTLREYNLSGAVVEVFNNYTGYYGSLFCFDNNVYYSVGGSAVKLDI